MAHETPPHTFAEKGTRPLGCEEWQELLVDALDGTLSTSDSAAFKLHARDCSACAQLLEETRRGSEWLGYLHHAPEAPGDLVDKILARTSGAAPGLPVLTTGVAEVEGQPWLGRSVAALQRHGVESRLLMTLAMAFFSIAFTLNLTGVHLGQLRLSDLSPSALATSVSRQYYTTSAHLVRYYENLRFVYEVESRVNEFRRDSAAPGTSTPANSGTGGAAPAGQPSAKPPAATPSGKPGGAASDTQPKGGSGAGPGVSSEQPGSSGRPAAQPRSASPMYAAPAQPVYAGCVTGRTPSAGSTPWLSMPSSGGPVIHAPFTVTTAAPRLSERNAVMRSIHDRTERSLA